MHEESAPHVRQKTRSPVAENGGVPKSHAPELNGASSNQPKTPEPEQRDRFGCTAHEAAELNAFRRVLLEGRVSPEEAVWQWCTGEDALDIRPEQLRKMWDFMVDAASQCREVEHHSSFLDVISVLYEVCTNHNVSVKQGKKVKARLEKVGPLRQQLLETIRPPVDEVKLEAVLDAVRSVELMLDKQLLERARGVQKTLQDGGPAADALRSPEPSEPESGESREETPCAAMDSQAHLHAQLVHAATVAMHQHLNIEATPPPPPPPRRAQASYAGADGQRGGMQVAEMAGPHARRMQAGHVAPAPPPPSNHMHPSARPAGMQPVRMPGAPVPPPPRGSPQPSMDPSGSRATMPAPPPPGPVPSHGPTPSNPFAGTTAQMADPMVDLLGSDLVGAMDSASSGITGGDLGQRGSHMGWQPSSGPAIPGAPLQQRGSPMPPPTQVRMPQHGSPGMRPYGSNAGGMLRMNPPANGTVSRPPPPGPPPGPPSVPGAMDGFGGPKPPGMQRNGMKVHHSPSQHQAQPFSSSYASGMHVFDGKPEPPAHQPVHSGAFAAMNQQQQRMAGEVAGRYKEQGPRYGQLSTTAPPFMPASKGSSNPQLPAAPMARSMEMHPHMFRKAGGASVEGHHRSVASLPTPGNEGKYMRDLPSDPFGLDVPLPGGNDVHHQRHLRRDVTSDAVTSVLGGHAVRPKHDLSFSSGPVPPTLQGQSAVQSDEVLNWLGNDILDALDDTS